MTKKPRIKYSRILLKLSGESLQGKRGFGIDPEEVRDVAARIQRVHSMGVQVAVVIGGGNIYRGTHESKKGIDRITADYMGMLATILNAVALQDALEKLGAPTRVLTAIEVKEIAEPFIKRRAVRHLEKGRIVIFAGGTGNPYFTTDTAAALRSNEIGAQVLIKATKVNGVYTDDPVKNKNARQLKKLSFIEVIRKKLKVMDLTAVSLCMENKLPIIVLSMKIPGNICHAVQGKTVGTTIS
ncbi:MAG: UMP kinase [Candidatus Aureabacteria bacterium]|nr:UMP kinase [Candidatus Auribacterota bacterium]